jgi:YfiH family protein
MMLAIYDGDVLPKPSDGFSWVQAAPGPALVCTALEPHAHLFTTRAWPLGASAHGDRTAWADVADALGADSGELVRVHQVHGVHVFACKRADVTRKRTATSSDRPLPDADIIVSNDPSIVLAVQAADCVPLLIADSRIGAVAAAHAGWRGLAAGVPRVAVAALTDAFGSRPANLVAAIGPSISAARYEVDDIVRAAFVRAGHDERSLRRWLLEGTRPAHWQFDGWASARDQLVLAGVPAARIHASELCTASHPETLPSYRRDGSGAGRIAAAIRARR